MDTGLETLSSPPKDPAFKKQRSNIVRPMPPLVSPPRKSSDPSKSRLKLNGPAFVPKHKKTFDYVPAAPITPKPCAPAFSALSTNETDANQRAETESDRSGGEVILTIAELAQMAADAMYWSYPPS